MTSGEVVSITCDECGNSLVIPIADIPEDLPLSVAARAFLDEHRGCQITIDARPATAP